MHLSTLVGLLFLSSFIALSSASAGLRLNHVQIKGSRNTYHIRPKPSIPQWEPNQESAASQLDQGVYALEYDFYIQDERFLTAQHVLYDNETHCRYMEDCLGQVKQWHNQQSDKPIIWLALGNKDDWTETDWDEFDAVIRSVWSEEDLLTPDMLRGHYPNLQQAIRANGWPLLKDVAGKIIIILDQFNTDPYYVGRHANLYGRLAFPYYSWDDRHDPNAVILKMNSPNANITEAVKEGFIVRTRADQYMAQESYTTQEQVDKVYFEVMDMNQDNQLDINESISFMVFGAGVRIGNYTAAEELMSVAYKNCASTGYISLGEEFECLRHNSNGNIINYTQLPTVDQSWARGRLALKSGAHHISSDYATPGTDHFGNYYFKLSKTGEKILCNPISTNLSLSGEISHVFLPLSTCTSSEIQEVYSLPSDLTRRIIIIVITTIGGIFVLAYFCMYTIGAFGYVCKKNKRKNNKQVQSEYDTIVENPSKLKRITNCLTCRNCCRRDGQKTKLEYVTMNYDSTTEVAETA